MKRISHFLSLTLFAALVVLPAQAQHSDHHPEPAEKGGVGMQQHHPMHETMMDVEQKEMMAVCLLPELGEELQLSDAQQASLASLRKESMAAEDAHTAVMGAAPEALALLTDEQRAAFDAMEDSTLHAAMMAHMHSDAQGGMSCPMMEEMMMQGTPDQSAPEAPADAHQH